MNDRMRAMVGEQGEARVHQPLGARYAGCSARTSGIAGDAGMMGGSAMTTRQDWQHRPHQLLGPDAGAMTHTAAVIAAGLGAVTLRALAMLAILAITRRPFRRPRHPRPSSYPSRPLPSPPMSHQSIQRALTDQRADARGQ